MNLEEIRQLTFEIKELQEKLDKEKELVLEYFRNMEEPDRALCENKIGQNGIVIQYFPPSITKSIDSKKLKEDGLYDKYVKESNKSDYVKVSVSL